MAKRLHTSYDLAQLLESWAKVLRSLPELPLQEFKKDSMGQKTRSRNSSDDNNADNGLVDLAAQLPTYDKEMARASLDTLTVPQIRKISTLLRIRTPSKARRVELIDMLLAHVFDIPAGQDVVRTFHRER